uniref:Uncharacterized protein n=1 Tax=Meloidogyne javanica TaxID=6303 RepID=A0A915N2I3_MELJA
MASTSALVSRALLLLTVALLLLECVVWCDMVGFAKHMKDGNNKIIKLGTGSGTDCVVEAGFRSPSVCRKKGSKSWWTVGFKQVPPLSVINSVWKNVPENACYRPTSQLLLDEGVTGCSTTCTSVIGEPRIWYCPSTKHKAESNSSIIVKFDPKAYSGWRVSSGHHCARENGLDYDKEEKYCHTEKVLRKAEQWEITDEAHKDTDFKYLFTLNILPLKIVPKHKSTPQRIDLDNKLDGNKGPKCEMSLRLSGSRFKQFGGSTPPGSKPTDGQTGPGGSSDPVVETTTSGPSGGAEASGSNMGLIIGIAIAVVVL